MSYLILIGVLLFSVATFAIAVLVLRTSRRSEHLGESRYELLLNQRDALEVLREERQMLREELQRRSQKQQRQTGRLEETHSGPSEDPERKGTLDNGSAQRSERQEWGQKYTEREYQELREGWEREHRANLEAQQRIEQLERDEEERLRIQQDKEQLAQKRQQLMRDLEREREERQKVQQQAERSQQEQVRLQEEYQLLRDELDGLRRSPTEHSAEQPKAYRPRWSRPVRLAVVLLGILALWFTSLVVALSLLQP
jgi:hypothetical protein